MEEPDIKCPQCGGEMRRVIHPVGIVFKGSGFYATDSRRSGTSKSDSSTKTDSTTAAEGKTETKADTTSGGDKATSGKSD
jgi:predicted nucleic acid-binding Zn ribbon protein